jgi:hypothetical protein
LTPPSWLYGGVKPRRSPARDCNLGAPRCNFCSPPALKRLPFPSRGPFAMVRPHLPGTGRGRRARRLPLPPATGAAARPGAANGDSPLSLPGPGPPRTGRPRTYPSPDRSRPRRTSPGRLPCWSLHHAQGSAPGGVVRCPARAGGRLGPRRPGLRRRGLPPSGRRSAGLARARVRAAAPAQAPAPGTAAPAAAPDDGHTHSATPAPRGGVGPAHSPRQDRRPGPRSD